MRAIGLTIALAIASLAFTTCSSDHASTCSKARRELDALDAAPPMTGQSFDEIQANVDRTIHRDALRGQLAAECR
jgi:hypothetical protein